MTTLARPQTDLKTAAIRWQWVAAALFLLAGAVRVYRLGADPLWLDEVITTQVVRRGFAQIFLYSSLEPHPPLYYLLTWLTSAFGAAQPAWAWRWASALAGALSVPALYLLARRTAGAAPAFVAAVWFVVSPIQVAFSQEARWPAVTLLLAILISRAFLEVLAEPSDRRRWSIYSLLVLAGLFTSYSLLLIVGVQVLYIFWGVRRVSGTWRLWLPLLTGLALVAVLAAGVLPAIVREHRASVPLTMADVVQSLAAGDLWRFTPAWPHPVLAALLLGLAALGVWHLWRSAPRWLAGYPLAQFAAPLLAYGLVASPLLHINLPVFEARQFMVLLPAWFVLAAHGLAQLWAWLPRRAAIGVWLGLSAVVVAGSLVGLARYWSASRSPEGQAAVLVAAQLQPDDALLVSLNSLQYYALRYYLPAPPVYVVPAATAAELRFSQLLPHPGFEDAVGPADIPLAEVRTHPRLWLLSVPGVNDAVLQRVRADCQVATLADIPPTPIRLQLLTNCTVPAAP